MTEEYKKYFQKMFEALEGINYRYWNRTRNKITIDNNSIVMLPSKNGIIVYAGGTKKIYTDVEELKHFIKENKPHIYD